MNTKSNLLISTGVLAFQYKRQFGVDSFDKEEIERYVDFVNDTIFARFE